MRRFILFLATRSSNSILACELRDPMHPRSDNKWMKAVIMTTSKCFYTDPAQPARARVQDVEVVDLIVDLAPSVRARVQDNRCAAGNRCGMKTAPLPIST